MAGHIAAPRIRLAVFDVPNRAPLLADLKAALPDSKLEPRESWVNDPGDGESVGVWHWKLPVESLVNQRHHVLRGFVHPLIARGEPYVVAFGFPQAALARCSLGPWSADDLDVEDIAALLLDDAVTTSYGMLDQLKTRVPLTPIERMLFDALCESGISAQPQVRIGPYIVDFAIDGDTSRLAVEADGHAYHTAEKDRDRDEALRSLGVEHVLHFTGSEIYSDPSGCAARVGEFVEHGMRRARHRIEIDRLDETQQAAVEHASGAARVLAPAGSGKTRTLVNRVVELVNRGVYPGAILVLAFNVKARQQLEQRLAALGVQTTNKIVTRDAAVHCATFNAFGYRYQQQVMSFRPKLDVDGSQQRSLMEVALKDAGLTMDKLKPVRGSDPLREFLAALAHVRAGLESPDETDVEIESYGDQQTVVPFKKVYENYCRRQVQRQCQSFDDQIFMAVMDMLENPERRAAMERRYEYILIDEFQDLNDAQLRLVDILSRPQRNLFVVGDDDQLIYGWRFAELDSILNFHEKMPPEPWSATYTLSTNYRSAKVIVDASGRLIQHNRRREPKRIRARAQAPAGYVRFFAHSDWTARADTMCGFLRDEHERLDCDWRNLAVLCRYRNQQLLVALALDQAKIPRTPLLQYKVLTHPAARLLRAYVNLVLNPSAATGTELRLLINQPNRYVSNDDVRHIAESDEPWETVKAISQNQRDVGSDSIGGLVSRVESLWREAHANPPLQPAALIDRIVTEFELERYWADKSKGASSVDRTQDAAGPLQVLQSVRVLARDSATVPEFLSKWDDLERKERAGDDVAKDDLPREEDEDRDDVVIGTIHSSKGREYRSVVIPDYDVDLARSTPDQLEEERRVVYVGVTRARDAVLLTIDRSREEVHPFLRELALPPADGEHRRLADWLAQYREQERVLAAKAGDVTAQIRATETGEKQKEYERELSGIGAGGSLEQRIHELESQLSGGGLGKLGRSISGKQSRLEFEVDHLRKQQERAKGLRQELTILQTRPEAVLAPLREAADELGRDLAQNRAQQMSLRDRRTEIELLFPASDETGTKKA